MVEIDGERVLAPSYCRAPKDGMVVKSQSERALLSQKTVIELLLADAPDPPSHECALPGPDVHLEAVDEPLVSADGSVRG